MAVITVTNTNDSGPGSLREAVANAGAGDTIDFASGVDSVTLSSPLVIARNVDIDADYLHDNGSFAISGEVVVQAGSTATLQHINITNTSVGFDAADNAQMGTNGQTGPYPTPGPNGLGTGANGMPGTPGGDATQSSGGATSADPALENDGTLTLVQCTVVGTATGGKGADGADGGAGGSGGNGSSGGINNNGPGVNGGNGADGSDGGAGSNGTDGGDAVGGIINIGNLTLEDSVVSGAAMAGGGGHGGGGGNGGGGGSGGVGGLGYVITGNANQILRGGNGGNGGNGADGGPGADGGNGGSAVGGIVNTGTVKIVGGAVLGDDSATAGMGGGAGPGGPAGAAGPGNVGYPGNPAGSNGNAGAAGSPGADGTGGESGTATVDYLDKGSTTGTFTINGQIFILNPDLSGQPTTVNISGSTPTTFTYDARALAGTAPTVVGPGSDRPVQAFESNDTPASAGSVDWRIVTGADGPLPGDFVGPTSGVLDFSTGSGISDQTFSIQLNADAAAPRNEVFTVELIDPATGDVIGSVNSLAQNVTNLDAAACFASGTRIETVRGRAHIDAAVETLAIGDLVATASGAMRPIRWLGHRAIDCRTHPRPHDVMPIRISAHAFGGGLPARDLTLSPGHPVLVDADQDGGGGHLVPIMCLINGTTIARVPVDSVTYWHVELDAHDILLAEGLPAESFLDWGNRPWFENGADHALANPDFIAPGLDGRCRPVAVDGPLVAAERRRLDAVFATSLAACCAWPGDDAIGGAQCEELLV